MANMPGVGLEIFKAGGGWRDQKWAPSRSVKLPSLRQGRVQTLPCSLGRWSARSPTLERGKPRLSALKRGEEIRAFHEKIVRFLVAVATCPPSSPAPLSPPPALPRGLPTASSPPSPRAVLHDFR
ncbi:hypothetical protein T11_17030 [Trichinella zimbabwensis]|uniref:Uncharacterized protein n=1 Tax=Trichinella zimbabwensis TaxID=268475 RepID=A0A0V1HGC4_9BILA|nr:hypothetical protein T11_17030 [Trichinella zimbabwensis]